MTSKKHAPALLAAVAATCVALVAAPSASAATDTYVGPDNGNWNVDANWSPALAPNGDATADVVLGTHSAGTTDLHVTLNTAENYSGPGYLNSVTLNSSGLTDYMILNESAGGVLVAITENIGTTTSENQFNQTGGYNVANTMNLGLNAFCNSNFYALSGSSSTLTLGDATSYIGFGGSLNIGVSGSGTFTQSDASVATLGGNVTLGVNSGSSGNYSLSGAGTMNLINGNVDGNLTVGGAGTGVFNQSGGTITAGTISIGTTTGTGTYNFSGGNISVISNVTIGSHGTFNLQSGSPLMIIPQVNAGGTFNVLGGAFGSTGGLQINGGLFQLMGSNVYMTHLSGATGTIQNGGTLAGFLNLNLAAPSAFSGVIQDGGAHYLSLWLLGGNFTLGGSANTYTGATFVQTGGTLTAGVNNAFSPNSPISMGGGTLDEGNFSSSIPSFSGSPGIININASGNLSFGSDNSSNPYGGTLTGAGTLTKVGTGNQTFTGGGSFTGTINITNGAITIGAANGLPTGCTVTFGPSGSLNVNANQSLAIFSSGNLNLVTFLNNATLSAGSGNIDTTVGTDFSGTGTFAKIGAGSITLGSGASDTVANPDSSLTISVTSGNLLLNKAAGTNAVAGPLAISGGSVILDASNQIVDTSTVTLTGGTLNINGFSETIGGLAGNGGNIALNGGTLTVAQSVAGSSGAIPVGPGTFIKAGAADLTLTGTSSFTGALTANAGRLILQGAAGAGSFTANSGGIIQFNAVSLNVPGVQIQANAGGTFEYLNANISNAFLRGTGTHVILAGGTSTFNGITTYNSTIITQNGPAFFNNFTNGGTLNNNASLTFNGATVTGIGIVNVNSALNTQDFLSDGVINVVAGATINNSVSNFGLGGGARMYIGTKASPGGLLFLVGGTTIEVNGALLVNDGTINGITDVNYGGQAQGIGTYGPVNVSYGGLFQPGFASAALPANGAIVSALAGSGTIDNATAGGNMNLTLSGASTSTFSGPIQNTTGTLSLAIQGTSSLTLLTTPLPGGGQSTNSYTGGTSISAGGTLVIGASGALPAGGNVTNNGAFFVNANSTAGIISGTGGLTVGTAASPANLILKAGSGASKLVALTLNSTSQLDLTNNPLIFEAASAGAKAGDIAQLAAAVLSGRNGGAWNGPGITSSTVAAHPTTLSVAVADNAALGYTTFGGQSVDSNSILAVPAVLGDVNLDGIVNAADFTILASNFNVSSVGWTGGDFNNDSVVNFADFAALSNNFGDTFATIGGAVLPAPASGVPEPASLGLLGAGLLGLAGRLRTRSLSPRNAAIRCYRRVSASLYTSPCAY